MSSLDSSTHRYSVPLDKRFLAPLLALVALVAVGVLSIAVGTVYVSPAQVLDALLGHSTGTSAVIVNEIRLPRVLVGAMVGACLAVSGAILQGVTRNPLADPHIFGISAGAGLVAVSAVVFLPAMTPELVQPLTFLGGVVAGGFAYLMAWRGGVSPVRLALAGIAVTSMLTAITSAVLVSSAFSAQIGLRWLIGGLAGRSEIDVQLLLPYFVVGTLIAMVMARQLNVIAMGDEVATSLGQHVERTRLGLMAVATLLASAAVSIAGLIGFVGLIVPHFVRLVIGSDYRFLIPTSALFGAVLIVLADTIARTMLDVIFGSPQEVPVGVLTAVLGGPVFILLVRQRA
jgi:iron complex transport system permease protein